MGALDTKKRIERLFFLIIIVSQIEKSNTENVYI